MLKNIVLFLPIIIGVLKGTADTVQPYTLTCPSSSLCRFQGVLIPDPILKLISDKDQFLSNKVLKYALEKSPSFIDHTWFNTQTRHKGCITVYPLKNKCRPFKHQLIFPQQTYTFKGKACYQDGQWVLIKT